MHVSKNLSSVALLNANEDVDQTRLNKIKIINFCMNPDPTKPQITCLGDGMIVI
tara:strand:- start:8 stop:169 length:162 start_codon:yes stop_codon:yes gene_type:complete